MPAEKSSFAATLELSGKVIAGSLAGCYVIGLITANSYLSSLGFSSFSFVRTQCIVTGVLVLFFFAPTTLPAFFVAHLLNKHGLFFKSPASRRMKTAEKISLVFWVLVLMALTPGAWAYVLYLIEGEPGAWLGLIFVGLVVLSALVSFAFLLSSFEPPNKIQGWGEATGRAQAARWERKVIPGGFFFLYSLLLFATLFAGTVYAHVPRARGGGRPERARVLLDPGLVADLNQVGFPIRQGMNHSLPLNIVTDTDDEVFLSVETRNFRLEKKFVRAVYLKTFDDDLEWELQDVRELSQSLHQAAISAKCPASEPGIEAETEKMILSTSGVPLHSPEIEWQCGPSCYVAVGALEEAIANVTHRCNSVMPASSEKTHSGQKTPSHASQASRRP